MFMGGKFDSRKTVSLKGKSRDSNKAALLEETRKKREARQRHRVEASSVRLLQRAFRRYSAVLALAARVREGWEAEFAKATKNGMEDINRNQISSLLRGVSAFALRASRKEDLRLVESVCSLVVCQDERGPPNERFLCSQGIEATNLPMWRRQMDGITALCLWALARSAADSPRQLLLRICSVTTKQEPWQLSFSAACELLTVVLETTKDDDTLTATTSAIRALLSGMNTSQLDQDAYPFLLRVFTTYDFSTATGHYPMLVPLLCGIPSNRLRAAAAEAAPSQTLPLNLLSMAVADATARGAFARVANYQFLQILLPSNEDFQVTDEADDDVAMDEAETGARAMLSKLMECQDMKALAEECLERSKAANSLDLALEAMAPLANLCSAAALTEDSHRQLYILNELAFSTKLVPDLWEGIHKNLATVEGRVETSAIDVDFDSCLGLLFKASCSLLLALDDEEFFSTDMFLSLQQWTELTKFTKHVVEVGLLQEFGFRQTPPGYSPGKTMDLAIRLLRMLSDRDCRRPFLDEWHSETVWNAVRSKPELREEVAKKLPFFIPLASRVDLLHSYLSEARASDGWQSGQRVTIRRAHLFEDAFEKLGSMPLIDFRGRIRVDFVDGAGAEMGIDGGGLFRELVTEVMEKGFHPDTGLFSQCSAGTLYPNPSSLRISDGEDVKHTLANYHFLGRMLGKSLMDSILINLPLATFFISKILRKQHLHVNNLSSLDEDVSKNLMALKNYGGDVEADFGLTFSIMEDDSMGTGRCVELIPNGKDVAVTNQNRMRYIFLVAKYRLHTEIMPQSNAFLGGFFSVIDAKWVAVFNENELQELVSGPSKIDIEDLRAHTVYSGTFDPEHPTIVAFWNVVSAFTVEQQRQLLKFVTSTIRSPLRGFRDLQPKFCVRTADDDTSRLPTSSTCANLLRLPAYTEESDLRTKLLQAISEGQGFYLS